MPFMPNPLRPGPLNLAQDIMNYTTNPHIEPVYSPITARGPMGHPIRDQVFERDTIGQPILESRVTGRSTMGYPITTPVADLGVTPTYRADNLSYNPMSLIPRGCEQMSRNEMGAECRKMGLFWRY